MDLQERLYDVLVVSAADTFNAALPSLFPRALFNSVMLATNIGLARRILAERTYDFVIVNSPLPDDTGVRLAIDACAKPTTVALILARPEVCAEIYSKTSKYGVFTMQKPISGPSMATALRWMASARERLRNFEKKTLSLEEKMESIRQVNRAKWLLIRELKMEELEAHRYIEKEAMDRCVSKLEIALEIIKTYS